MWLVTLSPGVQDAFTSFNDDKSYLALPFTIAGGEIHSSTLIRPKNTDCSFQNALNELDTVLSPRSPLYLILRRDDSLIAITFIPYLAKESERQTYLENRHELVRLIGENHISLSLICKEIGEITDVRSWVERDEKAKLDVSAAHGKDAGGDCQDLEHGENSVQDIGYKQNKCRLCDRRMKNAISPSALAALKSLSHPGATVQIVRPPRSAPKLPQAS